MRGELKSAAFNAPIISIIELENVVLGCEPVVADRNYTTAKALIQNSEEVSMKKLNSNYVRKMKRLISVLNSFTAFLFVSTQCWEAASSVLVTFSIAQLMAVNCDPYSLFS